VRESIGRQSAFAHSPLFHPSLFPVNEGGAPWNMGRLRQAQMPQLPWAAESVHIDPGSLSLFRFPHQEHQRH
jgi:hypothetical protein